MLRNVGRIVARVRIPSGWSRPGRPRRGGAESSVGTRPGLLGNRAVHQRCTARGLALAIFLCDRFRSAGGSGGSCANQFLENSLELRVLDLLAKNTSHCIRTERPDRDEAIVTHLLRPKEGRKDPEMFAPLFLFARALASKVTLQHRVNPTADGREAIFEHSDLLIATEVIRARFELLELALDRPKELFAISFVHARIRAPVRRVGLHRGACGRENISQSKLG